MIMLASLLQLKDSLVRRNLIHLFKWTLPLFCISCCIGCHRNEVVSEAEYSLSQLLKSGDLILDPQHQIPYSGWVRETYPDGVQIKSRSRMKDGKLHGESSGYFSNGNLQVMEHFQKGVSHGKRLRFNEDGSKSAEEPIVEGQFHGVVLKWHSNGQLAESIEYNHGIPHGDASAWFDDGTVRSRAHFKNGAMMDQQFWKQGELNEGD
jgi:antitoxin component YwqK of YwqJK toxin-antitoxin module